MMGGGEFTYINAATMKFGFLQTKNKTGCLFAIHICVSKVSYPQLASIRVDIISNQEKESLTEFYPLLIRMHSIKKILLYDS